MCLINILFNSHILFYRPLFFWFCLSPYIFNSKILFYKPYKHPFKQANIVIQTFGFVALIVYLLICTYIKCLIPFQGCTPAMVAAKYSSLDALTALVNDKRTDLYALDMQVNSKWQSILSTLDVTVLSFFSSKCPWVKLLEQSYNFQTLLFSNN